MRLVSNHVFVDKDQNGLQSLCTCCVYLTPKMREIDLSVTYVNPIALRVTDLFQNVLNSRLCVGLI